MSIISKMRKQWAVYWAPIMDDDGNQVSDVDGNPSFAEPVAIRCRWDDERKLFRAASGEEKVSTSIIYPDRDLLENGRLWLSPLRDANLSQGDILAGVPDTDDPVASRAGKIQAIAKNPNLRATEFLHTVYL